VLARQRQLASDQLGQLDVRLEHDLRRPGAFGVDVSGERQPAAADVSDPERTGRQGVDDRGEVGDVLEAEVARVREVDVRLRTAVHHHGHATPAVLVGHELDPGHDWPPRCGHAAVTHLMGAASS